MKTESLKKAIEKIGIKLEFDSRIRPQYSAKGKKYEVHWYDQEGSAICVYVKNINEEDDIMTDYFCGWFAKRIKDVIDYLTRE